MARQDASLDGVGFSAMGIVDRPERWDLGAERVCNAARTVFATIVDDDDLGGIVLPVEVGVNFLETGGEAGFFVEGGNDDREPGPIPGFSVSLDVG
jgi:hypothetical protein